MFYLSALLALNIHTFLFMQTDAFAQEFRSIEFDHIETLDKLVASPDVDVYWAVNGNVDPRGRSCKKLAPGPAPWEYKTDNSEIQVGTTSILIRTPFAKRDVKGGARSTARHCNGDFFAHSEGGEVLLHKNIPIIFRSKLYLNVCYLEAFTSSCQRTCIASAPPGFYFHHVIVGKKLAERVSKTQCQ